MRPSQYKHIAAWCRVNGTPDSNRRYMQRLAARENAEMDAVYRVSDAGENPRWVTMMDVGIRTAMAIQLELNRGG